MKTKTKNDQTIRYNELLATVGAWAMMFATMIGSTQVSRSAKQPIVVNTARPVYAYVDDGLNLWNRNDNENETVHLPSDFDTGVQRYEISGR